MRRCGLLALAGFVCLAVPVRSAQAQIQVPDDVQAMTRMMRDLRYEEAIQRGQRALREASPRDPHRVAIVYRLLGTAYFLLGDETHARAAWVQLFALEAEARPPDEASPKLRSFFERVRLDAASIELDPAPLKEVPEGKPFLVEARLAGTVSRVERVLLHYRTEGAGAYAMRRLDRQGGLLRATLPGVLLADGSPRAFEYWLEARDAQGAPVALVGTEAAPLRAKIIPQRRDGVAEGLQPGSQPEEPPVYKRWWFWGIVGGAVAASLGAGIYFGTRGDSSAGGPGLDVCIGFRNKPCP